MVKHIQCKLKQRIFHQPRKMHNANQISGKWMISARYWMVIWFGLMLCQICLTKLCVDD
jgi:hypothetical protein